MVQAEIVIGTENGIHLIPANRITEVADKYNASIHFKKDHMDMNAKSILGIVSAALHKGDKILCVCEGPEEEAALTAMKALLVKDLDKE